jgi:hypothetical protein
VATNVGGVKELLPSTYIIEKDHKQQLVEIIQYLNNLSTEELLDISQANYNKALDYQDSVLTQRRDKMFKHLLASKL